MARERRFFKTSETADYLGISRKSIYRAISRRQIPAVKVPGIGIRVDKQRLDGLLENQSVGPRAFGRSLVAGKR